MKITDKFSGSQEIYNFDSRDLSLHIPLVLNILLIISIFHIQGALTPSILDYTFSIELCRHFLFFFSDLIIRFLHLKE